MTVIVGASEKLAILGGPRAVPNDEPDLFHWPIITAEDEAAVIAVMRKGNFSEGEVTAEFEKEFSRWIGMKHVLGTSNGTSAVLEAIFGAGLGRGDEMIM